MFYEKLDCRNAVSVFHTIKQEYKENEPKNLRLNIWKLSQGDHNVNDDVSFPAIDFKKKLTCMPECLDSKGYFVSNVCGVSTVEYIGGHIVLFIAVR